MQGKGIVKFFLIVMTLVTLVQYALIYPTSRAERKADAYAQTASNNVQDELQKKAVFKVKRAEYLDSISIKLVVDWRPFLSFTYQQLKARQLALGLDLKGGMSIIMQVDLKDFIKALAGNSQDPALAQALTNTSTAQKSGQADYITLFASEYAKISAGGAHQDVQKDALEIALMSELQAALGPLPPLKWSRTITEKRATFACTPGVIRPDTSTPEPGIWLAGDYVASPYPATLEAAVTSAVTAARRILKRCGLKESPLLLD